MNEPLVDKQYQLQKFPGKGGWTYAPIPEILPDKHTYFGLIKVSGFIDGYELKNGTLMPLGKGGVFLSVKAEIRKQIKKQAGDFVHLVLYAENHPANIQEEVLICLQEEPVAYTNFLNCSETKKQEYFDWVSAAKSDDEKVARIASLIDRLEKLQPAVLNV